VPAIRESKRPGSGFERDVDMNLSRKGIFEALKPQKRADHLEVQAEPAPVELKQQVFSAALGAQDARADHPRFECVHVLRAQGDGMPDEYPADLPAAHIRQQGPPNRFHLGSFRHDEA
jgi:hypothetical protein